MNAQLHELPSMDSGTADHLNLIATRLQRGTFALGGGMWRFSLTPLSGKGPSWPSIPVVLTLEWGGGRLHLLAGRATLALLYAHQFSNAALDVLPESLVLAGFRVAWREALERIELASGRRVKLVRAGHAKAGVLEGATYRFSLTLDSDSARDGVTCLVATDAPGLALLAFLARRQPISRGASDPDTPIPLRLELGEMQLALPALRALSVNDVLLPDTVIDPEKPVLWLRADGRHAARARFEGQSIVIETLLQKSDAMDSSRDFSADPESSGLADVEVRLSFDLGEKTIRLAELSTLQPGQVFELGAPPQRLVSLRVNRYLIGRGELVRVGDQVGVRVLEIATPREGA